MTTTAVSITLPEKMDYRSIVPGPGGVPLKYIVLSFMDTQTIVDRLNLYRIPAQFQKRTVEVAMAYYLDETLCLYYRHACNHNAYIAHYYLRQYFDDQGIFSNVKCAITILAEKTKNPHTGKRFIEEVIEVDWINPRNIMLVCL